MLARSHCQRACGIGDITVAILEQYSRPQLLTWSTVMRIPVGKSIQHCYVSPPGKPRPRPFKPRLAVCPSTFSFWSPASGLLPETHLSPRAWPPTGPVSSSSPPWHALSTGMNNLTKLGTQGTNHNLINCKSSGLQKAKKKCIVLCANIQKVLLQKSYLSLVIL